MRTTNLELPSSDELRRILASESSRQTIRHDYLDKNPYIYDAYKELASASGADASWVDNYHELTLEELDTKVRHCTDMLTEKLLARPRYHDELFAALAISKTPQVAEGIFVFGSPSNARIKKAVQLYHEGYAPKLYLSGHRPFYGSHDMPEAERMREFACAHGVSKNDIVTENRSITLPDNVKTILDDFEHYDLRPEKLIIIATTYILQRATMEWYKFSPWEIETIPVSPDENDVSESMRRATWFKSERGVRQLLNEYVKIIFEHKMDNERDKL